MLLKSLGKYLIPAILLVAICYSQAANAIQAVVMRNIFYAPVASDFKPYLETYWQIDPQSLLFSKEAGAFQAKIRTDIIITGEKGIAQEEHYILATTPVTDGAHIYSQNIMDLRRYELKPGHYTLEVKFTDELKKSSEFTFTDSFTVMSVTTPMLSDLQFVDTSFPSDQQNIFQRNGLIQIPLCSDFFDEQRKTLHYYAEFYQPAVAISGPISYNAFISKKPLDPAINQLFQSDTLFANNQVQIIENKFELHTLPSGNYYLNLIIQNGVQEKITAKSIFFQVLNAKPQTVNNTKPTDTSKTSSEDVKTTFLNLNKTFLGKYTPAQIRAILKMLIPIADPNERTNINGFLKKPDDTYARYFIYNFWMKRNKEKPEEAWKEYADKVKEVNRLFGSSLLLGYESERGLIYLKYGPPTERIVVNNENNALPYEIWQYNTLPKASNALFLFYRPGLVSNDYRLLHTTVNGEIRNPNWRNSLYFSSMEESASNSRAEQYIGNR